MDNTAITATDQYLAFTLGNEQYAVEVTSIKEVLELPSITRIPKAPAYMKGVINIRGGVVPVLDLRQKFGMEETEPTVDTSIIVIELTDGGTKATIGTIADSVQEVIQIPPDSIDPAPKIGTNIETEFIDGLANYHDNFLIILNIEKVFTASELSTINGAGRDNFKSSTWYYAKWFEMHEAGVCGLIRMDVAPEDGIMDGAVNDQFFLKKFA